MGDAAQSSLEETYYWFNPAALRRVSSTKNWSRSSPEPDPAHRRILEGMRGSTGSLYCRLRQSAGYRDRRQVEERTHDIVVKLITGTLFRGFDQRTSGPMDLRFKIPVRTRSRTSRKGAESSGITSRPSPSVRSSSRRTVTAEELPVSLATDMTWTMMKRSSMISADCSATASAISAVAVLDRRLAGDETKSLVGDPLARAAPANGSSSTSCSKSRN